MTRGKVVVPFGRAPGTNEAYFTKPTVPAESSVHLTRVQLICSKLGLDLDVLVDGFEGMVREYGTERERGFC